MKFDTLCKDFNSKKPVLGTEKEVVFLFSTKWENAFNSSNDLLIKYLKENHIEYLRDFNGTVWFLRNGNWHNAKTNYNRDTNIATFSVCNY